MHPSIMSDFATLVLTRLIRQSCVRQRLPVIAFVVTLACSALAQMAKAEDGDLGNGNTAEGFLALPSPGGVDNTAMGAAALESCSTGNRNTAHGAAALESNNGDNNTAIGFETLGSNTTGSANTATGFEALVSNKTGIDNTASGYEALYSNVNGNFNTATGLESLFTNTGDNNTATGFQALFSNNSGTANTADGVAALQKNTSGSTNSATGFNALFNNTTGPLNTATGAYALYSNTTGQSNVGTGVDALYHNQTGHDNTGDGYLALLNSTGSNNTGVGSNAGANLITGSNNIDVGANVLGKAADANTIRIGTQGTQQATFIAGIYNVPVTGSPVVVNSNGKLGIGSTSSARFKQAIKPMEKASEVLLSLKPVTFRYKHEIDPESTPQFGLVAEQVERVDPDLVTHDQEGKAYAVRYDAVNAMMLNEFLKAYQRLEEQAAIIVKQQNQIEALAAGLQKVSAEVEARTRK
jgi:hypothetical protein